MDRERTTGPDRNSDGPDGEEVIVDVFVRSLAPLGGIHGEQVAVLARLDDLEDRGAVDGWTLTIWGERLCECEVCTTTLAGRAIHDQIQEFRDWTERVGSDVSLPFERRAIESTDAGTEVEALVPPRVTLAVYSADRLLRVFPCTVDGTHYSVDDALDWLDVEGQPVLTSPVG